MSNEVTLQHIEKSCLTLSAARGDLARELAELNAEIARIKKTRLTRIRKLIGRVEAAHEHTRNLVAEAPPHLFAQPKTVIYHGIKCGLQLTRDRLEIPDPERTIDAIRQHLADPATFIRTEESPVKEALKQLPPGQLRKLHCRYVAGSDEPVVRPVDGDMDKLLSALISQQDREGD